MSHDRKRLPFRFLAHLTLSKTALNVFSNYFDLYSASNEPIRVVFDRNHAFHSSIDDRGSKTPPIGFDARSGAEEWELLAFFAFS